VEARAQAGLTSTGAFARALLPTLVLVAAGLFAYRALIGYDPFAGFETVPDETEAFFFASSGSSPVLVAVVTVWLVFNRRYRIREAYGQPALVAPAAFAIATATGLYLWATYVEAPDLLVVSLISMLLGVGALLGGAAGLRALWLPAVFMVLLLPAPAELVNYVIFPLQLVTASISVWVLGILGIPAFQVGDQILTQSRIFQVIEACSGLRSIETLTMSGILYAELFYRSPLQAGLIVVAGPLIGFLVNQLRVLSLILNPYSQFAAVHTTQGIVMLVIGVLAIAAIDAGLKRILPAETGSRWTRMSAPPEEEGGSPTARAVALGAVLAGLAIASFTVAPWQGEPSRLKEPWSLPGTLAGWQAEPLKLDKDLLGSVAPAEWTHRRYTRDDATLELFAATDDLLVRRASLISDKTALPQPGLELRGRGVLHVPDVPFPFDALLFEAPDGRRVLVYRGYSGTASLERERPPLVVSIEASHPSSWLGPWAANFVERPD